MEFFEILPVQREQYPTFPRSVCQHRLVGHGKPIFACIAGGLHIMAQSA